MSEQTIHENWLQRCIALAKKGLGSVSPNPLVGAVIVDSKGNIGEGYHAAFGGPHAEILALRSVVEKHRLTGATLYVNLEPCCHTGKTPPCTDAILESGISRVVFGISDPNPLVSGQGAALLRAAGVEVIEGILEGECRELNRRFLVNQTQLRPYIILKWAETADGYIARADGSSKWISSEESRRLVHQWRGEEDAILVGTTTALLDNPKLTQRVGERKNPVRIALDFLGKIPSSHHLFDGEALTILVSEGKPKVPNIEWIDARTLPPKNDPRFWQELFQRLFAMNIGSLIIEGGTRTFQSVIDAHTWDEARVFTCDILFQSGKAAPSLTSQKKIGEERINEKDLLTVFRRMG